MQREMHWLRIDTYYEGTPEDHRDIERREPVHAHERAGHLPGGIGDLGRDAYEFVDFLARAGQTYWQILPLGPTGWGDSPYSSFSAFAGGTLAGR